MNINKNLAISENGFVFDPNTGESFSLNPVGVEILSYLKSNMSKDKIVKTLLKKYDTDEITIEKNYLEFLTMLREYRLIENE
ncbi:MAG: PqqD family protein [Victivallaceae bacterium]|nr:PqqD family protein [Victivallaceae bacterium]